MIQKGMNQLLFEVSWPKRDLLILDLPPGTGDVQLTITQSLELAGRFAKRKPWCKAALLTPPQVLSLYLRHKISHCEML